MQHFAIQNPISDFTMIYEHLIHIKHITLHEDIKAYCLAFEHDNASSQQVFCCICGICGIKAYCLVHGIIKISHR